MKKILRFPYTVPAKTFFILLGIFFSAGACTKEYSWEGTVPTGTLSIFTSQVPSNQTLNDQAGGIELGVRFRSAVSGYVKGIRFYKSAGNTGMHTGQLYSFEGTLLASAVFTNETDSGWQTVYFDTEKPITANTTYIAAYHSSLGNYCSTAFGFNTAVSNPPLTALADGADGINGLYKYSNTPAFPNQGFQSNNYWVDVLADVDMFR